MTSGALIDRKSLPQVALAFMNRVHQEELELVTKLLGQVWRKASASLIDALFEDWLAHTQAHFAREERLMETWGFPPLQVHKMAHMEALEALRQTQHEWLRRRDHLQLERYILEHWQAWLHQHISSMDFVTANFLSQFDLEVDV